jgi:hypothetical protein
MTDSRYSRGEGSAPAGKEEARENVKEVNSYLAA